MPSSELSLNTDSVGNNILDYIIYIYYILYYIYIYRLVITYWIIMQHINLHSRRLPEHFQTEQVLPQHEHVVLENGKLSYYLYYRSAQRPQMETISCLSWGRMLR